MQTGKMLKESEKETGHKKTITSLSKSADGSHFLTGSLDKSAKVLISVLSFLLSFCTIYYHLVFLNFLCNLCFFFFLIILVFLQIFLAVGHQNFDSYQDLRDWTSSQCRDNVSTSWSCMYLFIKCKLLCSCYKYHVSIHYDLSSY